MCHSSSSPKSYASSGTLLARDLVFGGDRLCAVSGFWDLLLLSFDNNFGLLVLENTFLIGEYDSREDVVFLKDDDGESSVGDSLGSRAGEVTLGSLLESPGGIGNWSSTFELGLLKQSLQTLSEDSFIHVRQLSW